MRLVPRVALQKKSCRLCLTTISAFLFGVDPLLSLLIFLFLSSLPLFSCHSGSLDGTVSRKAEGRGRPWLQTSTASTRPARTGKQGPLALRKNKLRRKTRDTDHGIRRPSDPELPEDQKVGGPVDLRANVPPNVGSKRVCHTSEQWPGKNNLPDRTAITSITHETSSPNKPEKHCLEH